MFERLFGENSSHGEYFLGGGFIYFLFLILTPTWGDDPIWPISFKWAEITTFLLLCYASNRYFFGSGQDGTGGWCSLVHKSKCCEPVIGCVGKLTWGRIVVRSSFSNLFGLILESWEFKAHISRTDMVQRAQAGREILWKMGENQLQICLTWTEIEPTSWNWEDQIEYLNIRIFLGGFTYNKWLARFLPSTVVVIKAAMTIFCPKHSWPKKWDVWTKKVIYIMLFVKIPKLADGLWLWFKLLLYTFLINNYNPTKTMVIFAFVKDISFTFLSCHDETFSCRLTSRQPLTWALCCSSPRRRLRPLVGCRLEVLKVLEVPCDAWLVHDSMIFFLLSFCIYKYRIWSVQSLLYMH